MGYIGHHGDLHRVADQAPLAVIGPDRDGVGPGGQAGQAPLDPVSQQAVQAGGSLHLGAVKGAQVGIVGLCRHLGPTSFSP